MLPRSQKAKANAAMSVILSDTKMAASSSIESPYGFTGSFGGNQDNQRTTLSRVSRLSKGVFLLSNSYAIYKPTITHTPAATTLRSVNNAATGIINPIPSGSQCQPRGRNFKVLLQQLSIFPPFSFPCSKVFLDLIAVLTCSGCGVASCTRQMDVLLEHTIHQSPRLV